MKSIHQLESDFDQLQVDIANGPILPNVTAEEIRTYLTGAYDFQQALPIESVVADVERC